MRAALLREYHRPLELVERPEPEPTGSRSVVVRVGGAGVCATDLHAIDGLMEPAGLTTPVVLGHENAGWVHAVGDAVTVSHSAGEGGPSCVRGSTSGPSGLLSRAWAARIRPMSGSSAGADAAARAWHSGQPARWASSARRGSPSSSPRVKAISSSWLG